MKHDEDCPTQEREFPCCEDQMCPCDQNAFEYLKEQLRLTQIDNNLLMTENARYREALEHYESAHYDSKGYPCMNDQTAREALKGE